jgi:drug/metabolite transporter (DMT)-like permease
MMLFLIPLAGDPLQAPLGAYGVLLLAVVIGLGLGDSLYFEGIRLVGVSRAMPITNAYPLFATLLALLFLHEPLTPVMLAGIITVVAGVYLVAQRGPLLAPLELFRGDSARGSAMVVLAGLCWACGTVLMRPALQQIDFVIANVLRMPAAALLMWLLVWQRGAAPDFRALKPRILGLLVLTGALTGISTLAFVGGVYLAGAAKAATLSSTAPLWAVPFSALLLREPITPRVLLGTLLSVAGIWLLLSG